jgi:hypothetical protein
VLSNIPDFVAVWGVFLYGVHWITSRREDVKGAPLFESRKPDNGKNDGRNA